MMPAFLLPFFSPASLASETCLDFLFFAGFRTMWITNRGKSEAVKYSAQLETEIGRRDKKCGRREGKRSSRAMPHPEGSTRSQPEGHAALVRSEGVFILIQLCFNNKH